jgi:hypothetical protein
MGAVERREQVDWLPSVETSEMAISPSTTDVS